ncbi:MAG: lysostaphin resistance A-like protein [Planctomycetota bacterium]|jgi:membrane protease YdiL (CAAX protease family)
MSLAHRNWLVLLALITALLVAVQWSWTSDTPVPGGEEDSPLEVTARFALGVRELEKIAKTGEQSSELLNQLKAQEMSRADRLRRAIVEAEVRGAEPALVVIRATEGELEDKALLERRYTDGELTEAEQEGLVERHGWFGELSGVYGLPDDDPQRSRLLESARRAALVFGVLGMLLIPVVLLGFILLAVFVVKASRGKIRARFALHDEGSGDLVWLQTVVIALAVLLALVVGLASALGIPPAFQLWLVPLALLWPLSRGVRASEWMGGLGLRTGEGFWREIRAGVLGYIGGIPIIVLGFMITAQLMHVTGLKPDHPIRQELASDQPLWTLVVASVIWAPIVEELIFRGAFYRYLRPYVSVVGSSLITSLLFASMHPQGLAGVPVLASVALVLAALREWRGSIYASMTAHALHNGLALVVGVNLMG